jgi:hypothetical protein
MAIIELRSSAGGIWSIRVSFELVFYYSYRSIVVKEMQNLGSNLLSRRNDGVPGRARSNPVG